MERKTYLRALKLLLWGFVFIIAGSSELKAAHVWGGYVTYEYKGGDSYKLRLYLYQDCSSNCQQIPNADFIIFRTADGTKVTNVSLPRIVNQQKIDLKFLQPCIVPPSSYDLVLNVYEANISLPDIKGGYTLLYDLFARNNSGNIQVSNNTSMTLTTTIPERAVHGKNSSPILNKNFPIVFCSQIPFRWDFSARDIEGDSIVYTLVTPMGSVGGSQFFNNLSDIDSIKWGSSYSRTNPLGGPVPMTIGAYTGIADMHTNLTDQMVFGVKLREFRKGKLISTTVLDVQVFLRKCDYAAIGGFTFPPPACDQLTMNFTNSTSIITAPNTPPPTYLWDFGDLSGNSAVKDPSHTYPAYGNYKITLIVSPNDPAIPNCKDTAVKSLQLVPKADPQFSSNVSACNNSASFTDLTATNPSGLSNSFTWYFGDGDSAKTSSTTHQYAAAGTYQVTLKQNIANTCFGSKTIPVSVAMKPTTTAGPDDFLCEGDTAILGGGQDDPSYSYVWSPATDLNSTSIAKPTTSTTNTITYFVTITPSTGPACSVSDQVTITVKQTPQALAGSDTTVCEKSSFAIGNTPSISSNQYLWEPPDGLSSVTVARPIATPLTTTTYSLSVSDQTGCKGSDSVVIQVEALPITDAGSDQTTCASKSVNLGGSFNPPANYSYAWSPSASLNDTTLTNPVAMPTSTTTYYLSVTKTIGILQCVNKDSVVVSVREIGNAGPDDTICAGTPITIGPAADPDRTYRWVPAGGITNVNQAQQQVAPLTNTTFVVTISDKPSNCDYIDEVRIEVKPLPPVAVGKDTVVRFSAPVKLAKSPANPGILYEWSPITGLDDPMICNATATPSVSTEYTLYARDTSSGCVNEDRILVKIVCGENDIFIPNAFTPNYDGLNDELVVEGQNIKECLLRVFDRWGKIVFESTNQHPHWDGQYADKPAQAGVYLYMLHLECMDGDKYDQKGNINLLR